VALSVSKIAPALIAGCTVVLKPSPESALDAMVLPSAGCHRLPPGVVNVVRPSGRGRGASEPPRRRQDRVHREHGAGRRLRPSGRAPRPLQPGAGRKSAAVVLDDADFNQIVPSLVFNAFTTTSGLHRPAAGVVSAERTTSSSIAGRGGGGPLRGRSSGPIHGDWPVGGRAQRDRVEGFLRGAQDEGARLIVGGKRPELDRGWFVAPTLFANVDNSMTIAREETFGR